MAEIEFNYEGNITVIHCTLNEKMKDIIKRLKNKTNNNFDNSIFLYGGSIIKEELNFSEQANSIDKERNKMCIIINRIGDDIDNNINNSNKVKTVICPQCQKSTYIEINDFKIILHDCENRHKSEEILFSEFEKTQNIDETKITCQQCNNANKKITFNNSFFRCLNCQKNICPLCKNVHDKEHKVINYDEKDYICELHYDLYNSYCDECEKNICLLCEKDHKGHNISSFGELILDNKKLNDDLKKLRLNIDLIINNIKEIILKLNNFIDNLEIYYKINSDIYKNYEFNNRNSFILINTLSFNHFSNELINYLENISHIENDKYKFQKIIELYDKMTNKAKKNTKKTKIFEDIKEEISGLKPDKYDNFNIKNIQEFLSFDTSNSNKQIIILKDSRILSYNYPRYKKGIISLYAPNAPEPTLFVYNLKNGNFKCDIIYETAEIYDMIQMDDGNIIISQYNGISVISIKEKEIEIKQTIRAHLFNIYKLSKENFLAIIDSKTLNKSISILKIYSYKNGEIKDNYIIILEKEIYNPCVIGENEVALVYFEKGIFGGFNSYIIIYDIKKDKQLNTIKFDGLYTINTFSYNDKYSIFLTEGKGNKKMLLFDNVKHKIEGDIVVNDLFNLIVPLNDRIFLSFNGKEGKISQYEIDNNKNKIKSKEIKENVNINSFGKYPGYKIYFAFKDKICIYG